MMREPLTEPEIARMRQRYADGVSKEDLAAAYRIAARTVTRCVAGVRRIAPSGFGRRAHGFKRALKRYASARRIQ